MPRRVRDERGVSTVELVLYIPILMTVILLAVQFSLYYLGRQTAGAAARETARVVRVTEDAAQARTEGGKYIDQVGKGVLDDARIDITRIGDTRVRVVVSGQSLRILPFGVPRVSQTVEGPIEQFVED